MEIDWSLFKNRDGYESVAVALNHRYQRLLQAGKAKVQAGEEKILVALSVEAKMQLFMTLFVDFGADDTVTREELFRALCKDFDLPMDRFSAASQRAQEIAKLWQQCCEPYN